MYLTKEEEKILEGEEGEAKRLAMEIVVRVGEALGAERLVDVSHAHVSGISYYNIGDPGLEFIEELARLGARFKVFTTFNPVGVVLGPDRIGLNDPKALAKQARILKALLRMGAAYTATCTPYRVRKPRPGEHLAWGESSAVAVANTLYAARTNREGGPVALAAAVVGKTYYWGLHLDENRTPNLKVVVERGAVRGEASAGLVGYLIAKYNPTAKPVVYGVPPSERLVISMCAAAAAQGSIAICFVEGASPEFKKASRVGVEDKLVITRGDIEEAAKEVSCAENGEPDTLFLGCPHYSAEEALTALGRAKRWRRVLIAVPAATWTHYPRRVRDRATLLPGTCPVVADRNRLPKPLATTSVKTAIYLCKAGIPVKLVEV